MTEIRSDLIGMLKSMGIDEESTVATVQLAKTDENRLKLMQMMADRYIQKGKVTDEDIGKMPLFLVGERKSSAPNLTKTEADTE